MIFLLSISAGASVVSVNGLVKAILFFLMLVGIGCSTTEQRPWNEPKSWEYDNGIFQHGTYTR
jgi:hypothetical protein